MQEQQAERHQQVDRQRRVLYLDRFQEGAPQAGPREQQLDHRQGGERETRARRPAWCEPADQDIAQRVAVDDLEPAQPFGRGSPQCSQKPSTPASDTRAIWTSLGAAAAWPGPARASACGCPSRNPPRAAAPCGRPATCPVEY